MVTVILSTTAGAPDEERNKDGSTLSPRPTMASVDTSLASLNTFLTVSSPRLATKAL